MNFYIVTGLSAPPAAASSPSPFSAVCKTAPDCFCGSPKQNRACIYYELGQNGTHSILFKRLSLWIMGGVFFSCLSDKAIVGGRRQLLLRYPPLFHFSVFFGVFLGFLLVVTTAVERLGLFGAPLYIFGGAAPLWH